MTQSIDNVTERSRLLTKADMNGAGIDAEAEQIQVHPEEDIKAWIVLVGCFCAFLPALSMLNSLGAYQAWLSSHQLSHEQPTKIGWIFSFYSFFSFSAGLFIGPCFDFQGPRLLSIVGGILTLLAYVLLGWCRAYYQFFLCIGVLGGLGTCSLFTAAVGTIQHWFSKRRGLATGLAISGGSIGGITLPILLGSLFPRYGFATTNRIVAAILLPFLIVSTALMEPRFSGRSQNTRFGIPLPQLSVLKDPRNCVMAIGLLLTELGIFIPVSYLTTYALTHGMSLTISYRLLTYLNIGSLIGRWIPGFIADKIGVFNMHILAMSFCSVSTLGIWLPTGNSSLLVSVFAVCFGFGSGCGIALAPVCIAQLCKIEEYGRTYSVIHTVSSFGALLGIPIAGKLLEATGGDYLGLIIFAGTVYAAGVICFVVVRVMTVGMAVVRKF